MSLPGPLPEDCFVISDLRGDYELLEVLLTEVMNIAAYNNKKWTWTVKNTTLICTGDFTDRFGKELFGVEEKIYQPQYNIKCWQPDKTKKDRICVTEPLEDYQKAEEYNPLYFTTQQAIEEETKIIQAFQDLMADQAGKNTCIVLVGNHELGNLLKWKNYAAYQMAHPSQGADQYRRTTFVKHVLRPFLKQCDLLARWGPVYISHGGILDAWLQQFIGDGDPKTAGFFAFDRTKDAIPQLNAAWHKCVEHAKCSFLFGKHSPFHQDKISSQPDLWLKDDYDRVRQVLGGETNPKFVVSDQPIQFMKEDYFRNLDTYTTDETIMTKTDSEMPVIYYIHNMAPDIYSDINSTDRVPHALTIQLFLNDERKNLYVTMSSEKMKPGDFRKFQNRRLRKRNQNKKKYER